MTTKPISPENRNLSEEWGSRPTRTILVHLNVEVPDDAPCTADDVATEIRGALEIAGEDLNAPILHGSTITIPLAEEV